MNAAPLQAGERLQFIANALATALRDDFPVWGALLALDRALPLMGCTDPSWREEHRELIATISANAARFAAPLAETLGGQVSRDVVFFGLSALAVLLATPDEPHAADRISYAKIMLWRLSIIIEEQNLADRGNAFLQFVESHRALIDAPSPSAATH